MRTPRGDMSSAESARPKAGPAVFWGTPTISTSNLSLDVAAWPGATDSPPYSPSLGSPVSDDSDEKVMRDVSKLQNGTGTTVFLEADPIDRNRREDEPFGWPTSPVSPPTWSRPQSLPAPLVVQTPPSKTPPATTATSPTARPNNSLLSVPPRTQAGTAPEARRTALVLPLQVTAAEAPESAGVMSPTSPMSPKPRGQEPLLPWEWPAWCLVSSPPCIEVLADYKAAAPCWVEACPVSLVMHEGEAHLCAEYFWPDDNEHYTQDFSADQVRRRGRSTTVFQDMSKLNADLVEMQSSGSPLGRRGVGGGFERAALDRMVPPSGSSAASSAQAAVAPVAAGQRRRNSGGLPVLVCADFASSERPVEANAVNGPDNAQDLAAIERQLAGLKGAYQQSIEAQTAEYKAAAAQKEAACANARLQAARHQEALQRLVQEQQEKDAVRRSELEERERAHHEESERRKADQLAMVDTANKLQAKRNIMGLHTKKKQAKKLLEEASTKEKELSSHEDLERSRLELLKQEIAKAQEEALAEEANASSQADLARKQAHEAESELCLVKRAHEEMLQYEEGALESKLEAARMHAHLRHVEFEASEARKLFRREQEELTKRMGLQAEKHAAILQQERDKLNVEKELLRLEEERRLQADQAEHSVAKQLYRVGRDHAEAVSDIEAQEERYERDMKAMRRALEEANERLLREARAPRLAPLFAEAPNLSTNNNNAAEHMAASIEAPNSGYSPLEVGREPASALFVDTFALPRSEREDYGRPAPMGSIEAQVTFPAHALVEDKRSAAPYATPFDQRSPPSSRRCLSPPGSTSRCSSPPPARIPDSREVPMSSFAQSLQRDPSAASLSSHTTPQMPRKRVALKAQVLHQVDHSQHDLGTYQTHPHAHAVQQAYQLQLLQQQQQMEQASKANFAVAPAVNSGCGWGRLPCPTPSTFSYGASLSSPLQELQTSPFRDEDPACVETPSPTPLSLEGHRAERVPGGQALFLGEAGAPPDVGGGCSCSVPACGQQRPWTVTPPRWQQPAQQAPQLPLPPQLSQLPFDQSRYEAHLQDVRDQLLGSRGPSGFSGGSSPSASAWASSSPRGAAGVTSYSGGRSEPLAARFPSFSSASGSERFDVMPNGPGNNSSGGLPPNLTSWARSAPFERPLPLAPAPSANSGCAGLESSLPNPGPYGRLGAIALDASKGRYGTSTTFGGAGWAGAAPSFVGSAESYSPRLALSTNPVAASLASPRTPRSDTLGCAALPFLSNGRTGFDDGTNIPLITSHPSSYSGIGGSGDGGRGSGRCASPYISPEARANLSSMAGAAGWVGKASAQGAYDLASTPRGVAPPPLANDACCIANSTKIRPLCYGNNYF